VVGTVPLIVGVGTTVVRPNGTSESIGYEFTTSITGSATSDPTASFEITGGLGSQDDPMTFLATSTDPTGSPLLHRWDFGDGASAEGGFVAHGYTRPGDYTVKLTSTNLSGRSSTISRTATVKAPKLALSIDLLGGATPPLDPDAPVNARVTVSASSDGVGSVRGIRFTDGALLKVDPGDAFLITDGPTPAVPTEGFDLAPGEQATFDVQIEPQIVGRYTISSQVTGTDDGGTRQTADASSPGEIGSALAVSITLDPPFADQVEGPDGPEPVDVTATISFTNTTAVEMDEVVLTSLRVDRTAAGQLLAVTQTGGADPGEDGLSIGTLAAGETKEVTATFRATDDAEVEFSALATGHLVDGRTEIGAGRQRWSVKPDKLLRVRTEVTSPPNDSMLPAGELVRISGTVKNLSNTATIDVGPLYPTLAGNAGAMSFAWSATGTDPKDMVPTGNVTLGPGESRSFAVRFLTTWSDPRAADESHRRSGASRRPRRSPRGASQPWRTDPPSTSPRPGSMPPTATWPTESRSTTRSPSRRSTPSRSAERSCTAQPKGSGAAPPR
jgi:PKD repeat protein